MEDIEGIYSDSNTLTSFKSSGQEFRDNFVINLNFSEQTNST